MGPVLGPHARTDRTQDTRVAEPWPPAPEDGQSGEGQRLTPDAPHNGGRHPSVDALPPPPQRATPARKGARCRTGAGSQRPHRPHPEHTGRGTLAAHPRGRAAGGGTAPDTRPPSQWWQASPPGDGPPPPPRHAAPTGHAGQGDSVGPPHPHARAHSTWVVDPNSPSSGRTVGGGGAPDIRRPSQQWNARAGRPRRDPPHHPPHRSQAAGAPDPTPRGTGDCSPSPRPREEPEHSPPPRPSRRLPQEPRGTSEPAPTRQDAAQIEPSEGGRARTRVVWGPRPP